MVKWMVLSALSVGACATRANPLYCDETADCKSGFVCNLDTNGCDPLGGDADVDSGATSCTLDDECMSGVCRDDGSCELAENILYVSPDGISAGACTPGAKCDIVYALSKVTPSVSTIRLENGAYDLAVDLVVDEDKPDMTIVGGRSAVLQRSASGVVIDVRGVTPNQHALTLRGMTMNKGVNCHYAGLRL